jgi:hypothetical protein
VDWAGVVGWGIWLQWFGFLFETTS